MNIQVFNSDEFGQIRTAVNQEGTPLFCAADVAKALGYSNTRDAVAKHVDTPDVAKRDVGVKTGKKANGEDALQKVSMTFVNESGLYALIFGSKLERAKELEMSAIELNNWLCDHGIQYRQSGQYLLYSDYAHRGYAQNRTFSIIDAYGEAHTRTYLVWTERGREFIHRKGERVKRVKMAIIIRKIVKIVCHVKYNVYFCRQNRQKYNTWYLIIYGLHSSWWRSSSLS